MALFRNIEEDRLRAGWRIAAQVLLMLGFGVLPILIVAEPLTALHRRGLFLGSLSKPSYDLAINMIVGPLLAIAVIASIAVAARWLDHRTMADYGIQIQLDTRWWRGLAHGLTVGASLMVLVFGIEYAAGWITIAGFLAGTPLGFCYSLVKVLCVGLYEEAFCRGYLMRNLADGLGWRASVAGTSAIFGLLHLTNDNASALSTVGLFVNGLLFCAAFLSTGRLSTAIGLHIAWNFTEGAVLGFPVSGDKEPASFVRLAQHGSDLWTGGAFGPEAGLVGIVASLAGILWFQQYARRSRRQ